MKSLSLSFCLVLLLGACAPGPQALRTVQVPQVIQAAFAAQHPEAVAVRWEKIGAQYEVEFQEVGTKREVTYGAQGQVVQTETEIAPALLPAPVLAYLREHFPQGDLQEVVEIQKAEWLSYELEVEGQNGLQELHFDAAGNLLESTAEEDESGDDDDDSDDGP